jgi:DNA-binding transcriptional LysR family regulator
VINVYQLQIFLTVVDRGSFSAAAEELSMSQPAVSQHVRALEEHYKVKLFARYGQRIELTEAGHALLAPARHLVAEAIQLDERFNAGTGKLQGRITILYSPNAAGVLYLLPKLFAEFYQKYPGVKFFLQSVSEEVALTRLMEHEVTFIALDHVPRQKTLESFLLQSDHLVLVLPQGHPWTDTKVELSQLKGQQFILRLAGSDTRRRLELALRLSGISFNDLQVVAEVDSAEAVALMVEAGLGLGFLANTVAQGFRQLGLAQLNLSEKEIVAGADLSRQIYLVRTLPSPDRSPLPSQQRFWEDVRLSR